VTAPVTEDTVDAVICRLAEDPAGNADRLRAKLDEVVGTLAVARRVERAIPREHLAQLEQAERHVRFELLLAEAIRDGRLRRAPGPRGELSWAVTP
jgi:hypothetical protein